MKMGQGMQIIAPLQHNMSDMPGIQGPCVQLALCTWTKYLGYERSSLRRLVSGVSKHLAPSGPHHGEQVRLLPVKRSGLLLDV